MELVGLLALGDVTTISLWAINLVVSICIGVVLNRVAAVTRKFERLEDSRVVEITKLENKLEAAETTTHGMVTKLVDERFRAMSHEMNNHVQGFAGTLDMLTRELKEREDDARRLGEGDHRLEIKLLKDVAAIKLHVTEHAASKEDLKEHRDEANTKLDGIARHLGEQDQRMAKIEQKCREHYRGDD
jgi:SMC interacting uncharacterized protein involved in chromosome segregation